MSPWSLGSLVTIFDHVRENGATVMSNSWGLGVYYLPEAVYDSLDRAIASGVTVLFSAGNGGAHIASRDLVGHPGVIAVGGVSIDAEHVSYSDGGPELDIVTPTLEMRETDTCPTGGIQTTDISGRAGMSPSDDSGLLGCDPDCRMHDDYTCFFSGTSASCPIAAGAVGLILSARPGLSPQTARWLLAATADRVGSDPYDRAGWNDMMGFGRVNVAAALDRLETGPLCKATHAEEGVWCHDGIDNDCDALVDDKDPDCGLVYPPAPVWSLYGESCTSEGEGLAVNCGAEMACLTAGDGMLTSGDGFCTLICESECPDSFFCAQVDVVDGIPEGFCAKQCWQTSDCPDGFRCVTSPLVAATDVGVCMPRCDDDTECPWGTSCSRMRVCAARDSYSGAPPPPPPPPPPADEDEPKVDTEDSGCRAAAGAVPVAAGLLPLLWRRRRRNSSL